ncbi:amp-CoA ligase, partial [Mycena latifolia]
MGRWSSIFSSHRGRWQPAGWLGGGRAAIRPYLYLWLTLTSTDSPSMPTPMLIPELIALNIETNPSDPFYVFAYPESPEIVTITHLEFGRATHRAASILRPNRDAGQDGQVVAMLALSDTILYHTIVPFAISPRNSVAGIFQLLRASSCHRILATCITLEPLLADLKVHIAACVLDVEEIPALERIYPNLGAERRESSFTPYPARGSRPSLDDVALYLHSSGSTGIPKAIAQTHWT